MVIRAFGEQFEVVYAKGLELEYAILQCRELLGGSEYTFLRFKGEQQIKYLLPYFSELEGNTDYRDYRGCFMQQEELYAAFYRKNGRPLSDLLENGQLPLEQRLLLGRRILEKFLLWMLPPFMVGQLLDLDKILVHGDEISFDYTWRAPVELSDDMALVSWKAAGLIEALTEQELAFGAGTEFTEFLERLKRGKMKDIFQIYEEYDRVYHTLPPQTERLTGIAAWKAKFLGFVNGKKSMINAALLVLAYMAIVIALVSGMRKGKPEEEQESGVAFERIGTLEILDDAQ